MHLRSKPRKIAWIASGLLVAIALAVPLSTTISAGTCCTLCSCVQLCCTNSVCGEYGGDEWCNSTGCGVNCNAYQPQRWLCSQYCSGN
jgi:hypothetical protein